MHLSSLAQNAIRLFILCSLADAISFWPLSAQTFPGVHNARGAYFGQTPPGETPLLFAPEILGTMGVWVETTALSPDGTQFFLSVGDTSYSNDGTTLTFTGRMGSGTLDLWTVRYTASGWDAPAALPPPVNSGAKEYRASYLSNGTMYFGSTRSGMMQVYKTCVDTTRRPRVELVGPPISVNSYEGDPCVAPDGRFLVFYSGRDGKSSVFIVRASRTIVG
jgi:hypothetical protein